MTVRNAPAGLADQGKRLWTEVWASKPGLNPGEVALLEQACRLTDRLARFDQAIADDPDALTSGVGAEARQHVAELRQVVKALALPAAKDSGAPAKTELELLRERKGRAG